MTTRQSIPNPYEPGKTTCYCCDAMAVGLRDQRPEGGMVEPACKRHMDPTLRSHAACSLCEDPVRAGSLVVDGRYVHKRCERDAARYAA